MVEPRTLATALLVAMKGCCAKKVSMTIRLAKSQVTASIHFNISMNKCQNCLHVDPNLNLNLDLDPDLDLDPYLGRDG